MSHPVYQSADELAFLGRPGQQDIQTDLFYDYRTNVASYPAWQEWLRAPAAAAAGGVGPLRPVVPAGRGGGVPSGCARRRGPSPRRRPLRPGRAGRPGRGAYPAVPAPFSSFTYL